MKSTIKGLFAVAALALTSLFFAAPANAALSVTLYQTNNNISCYQHSGSTFPEDGHLIDCTTGAVTNTGPAQVGYSITAWRGMSQQSGWLFLSKATAKNAQIYVFNSSLDYYAFATADTCCTTAQKMAAYTKYLKVSGFSQPSPLATIIFAAKETGTYPLTTPLGSSENANLATHEGGHIYDFMANGSSYPSFSAAAAQAAAWDVAYMKANDTNYSTDIVTYKYWLQYNQGGTQTPDVHWAEQFAEQTARFASGQIIPVDGIIGSYWMCSRNFTEIWLKQGRNPTTAEYSVFSQCH
ncbi:MAG: hypothetical protein KGS72_28190 [Cyanobacteria bacterium REEB67]|nr:hypothetical protein [Cyanobacteria bacterium REEB67]